MDKEREIELQKKNIEAIEAWCKKNAYDRDIYVRNAFEHMNNTYYLRVGKEGIVVSDGENSFSVRDDDVHMNNLKYSEQGKELIYNWSQLRKRIILAIGDEKHKDDIMEHFVVDDDSYC